MFSSINTKGLIQKHGYEVVVSSNGDPESPAITVLFPERKQLPFYNSFLISYCPKEQDGIYGVEIDSSDMGRDFLICNKYAAETIILEDIFKLCEIIRYNKEFVSYHVANESCDFKGFKSSFDKIIKLKRSEKSKKKKLESIFEEAKNNSFLPEDHYLDLCAKDGLVEDYFLLKRISYTEKEPYE